MGLKRFFVRRGAVGGTARWAGKLYLLIKARKPDASINEVMSELLEWRYRDRATEDVKQSMLQLVENNKIFGLAHLVTNILSVEAGFRENSEKNRLLFMDVIEEELAKLGVPEKDIFDYSRNPFE